MLASLAALTILSLNTQDLPPELRDERYPDGRTNRLAELAAEYDVVLMQEVFVHPRQLHERSGHAWSWWPFFGHRVMPRWLCELCGSPGLLMLSRRSAAPARAEPFQRCSGWFRRKWDCWSRKGFQIARLGPLWLVNTHLDAGRTGTDRTARSRQLAELAGALPEGPLVLAGDLNLKPGDPRDTAEFEAFHERTGLRPVLRHGRDAISVRGVAVEWVHAAAAPDLSDHPALAARIRLE